MEIFFYVAYYFFSCFREYNYGAITLSILQSLNFDVENLKKESLSLPPEDSNAKLIFL